MGKCVHSTHDFRGGSSCGVHGWDACFPGCSWALWATGFSGVFQNAPDGAGIPLAAFCWDKCVHSLHDFRGSSFFPQIICQGGGMVELKSCIATNLLQKEYCSIP